MTADPYIDDVEQELDPRWRDHHTLLDERLARWVLRRLQVIAPHSRARRAAGRYLLNRVYCGRDGQCIFRRGHRGSCCWGDDGDE